MLDPVPFRGARRVVADGDFESGFGGEFGELGFPGSDPGDRWNRRRRR